MTQVDASTKLEIARTTYSGYERGTSEPDFEMINKMAKLFNVSTEWLINGKETMIDKRRQDILEDIKLLKPEEEQLILDMIHSLLNKKRP